MCAVLRWQGRVSRPGKRVLALSKDGMIEGWWIGFAREEKLEWWLSKGFEPVDVLVDEFAERSRLSGNLVWDSVFDGEVIYGLLQKLNQQRFLRILTRGCSKEEAEEFGHNRLPLIGAARFVKSLRSVSYLNQLSLPLSEENTKSL
ncbi:MAG: hypothetical protein N2035_00340 [Chthoniobacterales bacterium]|nr:hypothetical protein [Chthoniobacterales bacterium]